LTKSRAIASWLLSLVLLALAAGQSWQSFEVSADAGASINGVTGFLAFPVIGTIISLQVVIVLVSFLVKPLVTRFMAGSLSVLMVWNFVDVLVNVAEQTQFTYERMLAEQTGILSDYSNSEFLVSSSSGVFQWLYLGSIGLNIMVLISIALLAIKPTMPGSKSSGAALPEDLWSRQNLNVTGKLVQKRRGHVVK